MEAKHEFAADVAAAALARAHDGLRAFLVVDAGEHPSIDAVVELLTLAPLGLKSDRPAPAEYRQRRAALADAAAALLDQR